MFLLEPPGMRSLHTWTRLPDRFRITDRQSDWAVANRGGAPTDSFLEGPVWDASGALFVCDIPYGRIFRIDAHGDWDLVTAYAGEPNGMKFLDASTLLVADYRNGLMAIELASGQVREYLPRRHSERFKGINDLTLDSLGNIYFTDQGQTGMHDPTGRVYRLSPAGKLDLLISNGPSPNGLALSPDEQILYVAMTRGNSVWRVPLQPDGGVSKVGQFFTSYGPSGPDGLAFDRDERLLVCNPGLGWAWALDRLGRPREVLACAPGTSLTNVAVRSDGVPFFTQSTAGEIVRPE